MSRTCRRIPSLRRDTGFPVPLPEFLPCAYSPFLSNTRAAKFSTELGLSSTVVFACGRCVFVGLDEPIGAGITGMGEASLLPWAFSAFVPAIVTGADTPGIVPDAFTVPVAAVLV